MEYFFFYLIFLYFVKINLSFFFNYVYFFLIFNFLFNFFLLRQYYFFNFKDNTIFFYSFLKWRTFFFNRWFSFLRYNNIFFSYKKNIKNFSLSVEGYDYFFKNILFLYKKINFKLDDFIFYYPFLFESKFFFFNKRIFLNTGNINFVKNYLYLMNKYLLITDKKLKNYENTFFNQTKLSIFESEKNRMLSSFKDKETLKLISNLLKICSKSESDFFFSQLKSKILLLCDLEKNKDDSDEQHLIDKLRKLIITDKTDEISLKLSTIFINSEKKIELFEKILLNYYNVKLFDNKNLFNTNKLSNIVVFQKNILELEENPSSILLNDLFIKKISTKSSLDKDEKSFIENNFNVIKNSNKKIHRRFNYFFKKNKFYPKIEEKISSDIKDNNINVLDKPKESFILNNFININENLNFVFEKKYSFFFKKTFYNFFYTSFKYKKKFNRNILNFVIKKKTISKKKGFSERFYSDKKHIYNFFFFIK
jgi:hypothetical protein